MHTVVETPAYIAQAKSEGMTVAEMTAAVNIIAADPAGGDVIQGSGGCRKVRIPGKGRGKSGGYRLMTVYGGNHMPVYILAVLSKGSAGNFTAEQIAKMATMAKAIIEAHRPKGVFGLWVR